MRAASCWLSSARPCSNARVDRSPELRRDNLGFLLAKASQRWNEVLASAFAAAGFPEVSPAFGSILLPLAEEDGLQIGELGRRSRLTKQTMTTMIRLMEERGLVDRRPDVEDRRASRIYLTERSRAFLPVAQRVLRDLNRRVESRLTPEERQVLHHSLQELINLD
jgi:DNA-binding MarR family transcriptional regulator